MRTGFALILLALGFLVSCGGEDRNQLAEEPVKSVSDTVDSAGLSEMLRFNREVNSPDAKGIRGVYEVPEMLSMVILDSASQEHVAEKRAAAFAAIEADIKSTGAEVDGSPGSIYYTNNPRNFKFECLMLIRRIPSKNPEHSKIVVLEKGPMLICNHAGGYASLYRTYAEIKHYLDSLSLKQMGPMREFYISSPLQTQDSMTWLTRIMVPVDRKP
ncbi:MAG TPA: GyrI-like domain-containing protein [Bacteroidia bacterium]|nr:GyrI-like domain-containing protein [Bacteroidia bacterium]